MRRTFIRDRAMKRSEQVEAIAGNIAGLFDRDIDAAAGAIFDEITVHEPSGEQIEVCGFGRSRPEPATPGTLATGVVMGSVAADECAPLTSYWPRQCAEAQKTRG